MSSYGRNFEFRVPPGGSDREGRWATHADQAAVPIGAPVLLDAGAAPNTMGLPLVQLAVGNGLVGGGVARAGGNKGIAVYEYGPAAFAGDDRALTTFSDKDIVPPGAAVQVVHDPDIKVVLRNTVARTFLGVRSYPGRLMIAPADLAGLALGNFLTPGLGTDVGGYWAKTTVEANAWLVITSVDTLRGEVEARMLF